MKWRRSIEAVMGQNTEDIDLLDSFRSQLKKRSFWKEKNLLIEYFPLFCILIAFALTSFSIGPYNNGDTVKEYDAVTGILKTGVPVISGGYLMDEPPFGFYIQALFFSVFGAGFEIGLIVVMFFALGSIALVYGISKFLYGKTAGFFATLLFAFSPWQIILSRSFLIDAPCLFFSLLSLFVGLFAFCKSSLKLILISGFIFAVAFNTKLYAVFILAPLMLFFWHYQPHNYKNFAKWIVLFSMPIVVVTALWYQTMFDVGLAAIYNHTDLAIQNPSLKPPTIFFALYFLINYGVGWLFMDAIILSIVIVLWQRQTFRKYLFFDFTFLIAVIIILSVNVFLGAILNLKAPYWNTIKYSYQALPFLSILAGSLMAKSTSLFKSAVTKNSFSKIVFISASLTGLILVLGAFFYNWNYIQQLSHWNYLIFRVEPNINEGYSLFTSITDNIEYQLLFGYSFAIIGIIILTFEKFNFKAKISG